MKLLFKVLFVSFIFTLISCVPETNKKCEDNQILVNGSCVLKDSEIVVSPTPTIVPDPTPTLVPTVRPKLSCGSIPHNGIESRIAYSVSSLPYGQSCSNFQQSQTRTCNDGVWSAWSGTYTNLTCSVAAASSCGSTPNNGTESRIAYSASSVPYGQSCSTIQQSQTRTCNNGTWSVWSGTYTNLTCTVQTVTLTISDGATYNYGSRTINTSTDKIFTISNSGTGLASAMSGSGLVAPFTFKGGSYPGTGGNCGTTLATSGSCTIVVTYIPTTVAVHSGTITMNYHNGVSVQTIKRNITGTGLAAQTATLTISDGATYNYGSRTISTSPSKVFTITNSGAASATVMSGSGLVAPFTFKGGSYPGTGGTCGATLAASGTCTFVVTYTPTTVAVHNGTITINYYNGVSAQTTQRNITGTGVAVPIAILSISDGATYNFGSQELDSVSDKVFTVSNSGLGAASAISATNLLSPFTFKGDSYPGTGGNCGGTLAAAASCIIVVTYIPTTAAVHSGTITINYNNGIAAQTIQRNITGTGINSAIISSGAGVFLSDSFESGGISNPDIALDGARWTGYVNSQISTANPRSGAYSAQFNFAGNSDSTKDSTSELRFNMGIGRKDFYVAFWIYFPSNYVIRVASDGPENTKLMVFWPLSYSGEDRMAIEYATSMKPRMKATLSGYPQYSSCSGGCGYIPESPSTISSIFDWRGKWTHFEFHRKLDTGSDSAVVQMWVNGVLEVDASFQTTGAPCNPGYMINGYLMGWSNAGFTEDTTVYIDDVVMSTKRIGMSGGAN